MKVEREMKSTKQLRIFGVIVVVVSFIFILASLVMSVYDYAGLQGWERIQNLAYSIYAQAQLPILSNVWNVAARPNLAEPLQAHNLGFFFEFVVFFIGFAIVITANKIIRDIASAEYEAIQQNRKEQFQKKQREN